MTPKIFALILNYNRPTDTVNCARALAGTDLASNLSIVIIDNGPRNLRSYFSRKITHPHTYLKSPGNIGFAAGNNQGIKLALKKGATHVLIINPDVIVPSKFFLPLLSTFKDHKNAGVVGPAHINTSVNQGEFGLGGHVHWDLCTFPHDNVTKLTKKKSISYDLLTFACVLIKREVFERVGGLDERYFLYIEDVDYCVTVARAGFELRLNPEVVIKHKLSASFDNPIGKLKYSFRSHLQFIDKWYRFPTCVIPTLYQLYFYPRLYLLWTAKQFKRRILKLSYVKRK